MGSKPQVQAPVITAPPPPTTETSLEVIQAKQAAKQQAKARQGINSTILADKVGSTQLAPNASAGLTLLGGG